MDWTALLTIAVTCLIGWTGIAHLPTTRRWSANLLLVLTVVFFLLAAAAAPWRSFFQSVVWILVLGAILIALIGSLWRSPDGSSLASQLIRKIRVSGGPPAYWTLTEALSWMVFGEAATTELWPALSRKIALGLVEERHRLYTAERLLFENLRNPDSGIDVQGKENGIGLHKPVPPNVFLSDVGASICDDSLGMPNEVGIGTILTWDGPKWTEVRIRQAHIRKHWRTAINIPTVADDLAGFILETRAIMDELQDHESVPPREAIGDWRNRVTEYVRRNMGREYEARFAELRTFSDEELGPLGRNPVNTLRVGLQHKINLLYKFIEEAKAK